MPNASRAHTLRSRGAAARSFSEASGTGQAKYHALIGLWKSYVTLGGTHKFNVKYRMRVAYFNGKSGDTRNVTTDGAYKCFISTK